MTMVKRILSGCVFPLAAVLLTLSAGCSEVENISVPEEESGPEVTMRFIIDMGGGIASSPAVRSVVTGYEEGLLDENFIAPDDICFILCTDGGVFLQELKPSVTSSEGYSVYTAETTFREPYFDISGSDGGEVGFGLLVAANWRSVGGGYDGIAGYGSRFGLQDSGMWFPMPKVSPYPSYENNRGIPMYGYAHFSETVASLKSGEFVGQVALVRSLVKVEVSDKIDGKGADGYPKVVSVAMKDHEGNAAFVPWKHVPGEQVTDVTIPAESNGGCGSVFKEIAGESPLWRLYCPETKLSAAGPFLEITIANSPDAGSPWEEKVTYTVNLDKYEDFEHELLRNHIYRIDVTGAGSVFSLNYTVCPWDERDPVDIPDFE